MKKRMLALLLCLVMLVSILPTAALAATADLPSDTDSVENEPVSLEIAIEVIKHIDGVPDKDAYFQFKITPLADGLWIDDAHTSNGSLTVEVLKGETEVHGTLQFGIAADDYNTLYTGLIGSGFEISEIDTKAEGWIYDKTVWTAILNPDPSRYNGQVSLTTYDFSYYKDGTSGADAYGEVTSFTTATGVAYSPDQQVNWGDYARIAEFTNKYTPSQESFIVSLPVPFTKVVEVEGNGTAPEQTFRFGVTGFNAPDSEKMLLAVEGGEVETNGAGTYEGCLYLDLEMDSVYALGNLEEGFILYEVPDEAENWTFDDTAWFVQPDFELSDTNSQFRVSYTFYSLEGMEDDSGEYGKAAQQAAVFTNIYTAKEPVTFEFPYSKAVLQAGTQPSGNQSFTFELSDFGHDVEDMTVEGTTIETTGPGTYNGTIKITVPQEEIGNLSEGFLVTEKNTGLEGWSYSEAAWYCCLKEQEDPTDPTKSIWVPEVYNVTDGNDSWGVEPEETMLFINTFTKDIEVVEDRDYILHYESNGGTEYPDETYAPNTTVPMTKYPFREGYTFTGWYLDAGLTVKITSVLMDSDKTVYAGWSRTPVPKYLNGDDHFAYVIGYEDGTTRPLNNITRAEVAMIFFRLLKLEYRIKYETDVNSFTDVNVGDWYCTAVSTLASMGILNGRSATSFAPNAYITRAEFAAICARCDESVASGVECFNDLDGHWAKAEVEKAAFLGWIKGYADGSFQPDKYITRAEAFTLINRVLQRIPGSVSDLLPEMAHWPDNADTTAWYYIAVQEATCSHEFQDKGDGHERWVRLVDNVF